MAISVFLDLDDTILDFHQAEADAIVLALRAAEVDPTAETVALYSCINVALWKQLEQGLITRPRLLVQRFEELFDALGVERDAEKIRWQYEEFLSQGNSFIPGGRELLENLKGKYPLYLASNGNLHIQNRRLDSTGIRPYFKDIFVSELVGHNKPSKAFFDVCFAAIEEFEPDKAIIVGDSLSSDILGGINAGIKTCWFNPQGKPGREDIVPDYEIRDLAELPPLLERVFHMERPPCAKGTVSDS